MKFTCMSVLILGFVSIFSIASPCPPCRAAVEWDVIKTLNLDGTPLDVAVSPDGRLIYVLLGDGNIQIFEWTGQLRDEIRGGKDVDHIMIGPGGEQLFAPNRQYKTAIVISLSFIYDVNVPGSPFKGPSDAPVVIAVFSDSQ